MSFLSRAEAPFLMASCLAATASMLLFWAQLLLWPAVPNQTRPNANSPNANSADANSANANARYAPAQIGRALLWGGAIFGLFSLAGQGPDLFMGKPGVVGLFGWILIVSYLVGGRRLGAGSGALVSSVALCALFYSLAAPVHRTWAPNGNLESFWLTTHVFLIVAAYVALAFAFVASLLYLVQESLLKRKKLTGLWQKLPSLGASDQWIFRATAFGVALLTLGLVTGVAFSSVQIAGYAPLSDPKVLFSGATWAIFAAYLVTRWQLGWHGRRSNLVVIYGFVVLAVSFFGVSHLVPGG